MEDADPGMEGLESFCGDIADTDGTPLLCSLFKFRSISFSIISFMVLAEPIWGRLTKEDPAEAVWGGTFRLYLSATEVADMTTPEIQWKIFNFQMAVLVNCKNLW